MIRYQGRLGLDDRGASAGFLSRPWRRNFPGLTVFLGQGNQYAGPTTESAYQTAENLLGRFPDVEGVFCPNESSTFGALRALRKSRLAGKVMFVGFQTAPPSSSQALADGHLQGLVLQKPSFKIGYLVS